jgi:L,D-peptidoglycan transpeptidase YkuD (ErfK/YbiS/YcfS/YnhG family)
MTVARVFADGHPGTRVVIGRATYRACLGRAGIVPHKQEGDGGTPAGLLPLRKILYRADRIPRPQAAVPVEPIAPTDGWCDDPFHADYNRMVRLPHGGRHEALWRGDPLYDLVGVLGWNDSPVQRGRGSAIFLHVARPDYAPTEGCVALAHPDLVEVIATLTVLETG